MEKNRVVRGIEVGTKKHKRPGEPDAVMIRFRSLAEMNQEEAWTPWFWMPRRIAEDLQLALTTALTPNAPPSPGHQLN